MTGKLRRMAHHWAIDRSRTLAKQGKTDEEISSITGLPILNVMAYTLGIPGRKLNANQANQKRKTHDRQIRQDDNQTDSAERTISQPEDRNAKID